MNMFKSETNKTMSDWRELHDTKTKGELAKMVETLEAEKEWHKMHAVRCIVKKNELKDRNEKLNKKLKALEAEKEKWLKETSEMEVKIFYLKKQLEEVLEYPISHKEFCKKNQVMNNTIKGCATIDDIKNTECTCRLEDYINKRIRP